MYQELTPNSHSPNTTLETSRLTSLTKENNLLKEHLRAETLNSEELRVYIDIMRQGVAAMIRQYKIPKDNFQEYFDLTKIQEKRQQQLHQQSIVNQELQQSLEIRLNSQIKSLSEDAKKLQSERNALQQKLKQVEGQLASRQKKLNRLEVEKENLLDYITEREKQQCEECLRLREEYDSLLQKYQENATQQSDKDLIRVLEDENQNLADQCKELRVKLSTLHKERSDLEQKNQKDTDQATEDSILMKQQINKLENALLQLKQEHLEIKEEQMQQLNELSDNYKAVKDDLILNYESQIANYIEQISKLENSQKSADSSLAPSLTSIHQKIQKILPYLLIQNSTSHAQQYSQFQSSNEIDQCLTLTTLEHLLSDMLTGFQEFEIPPLSDMTNSSINIASDNISPIKSKENIKFELEKRRKALEEQVDNADEQVRRRMINRDPTDLEFWRGEVQELRNQLTDCYSELANLENKSSVAG